MGRGNLSHVLGIVKKLFLKRLGDRVEGSSAIDHVGSHFCRTISLPIKGQHRGE